MVPTAVEPKMVWMIRKSLSPEKHSWPTRQCYPISSTENEVDLGRFPGMRVSPGREITDRDYGQSSHVASLIKSALALTDIGLSTI